MVLFSKNTNLFFFQVCGSLWQFWGKVQRRGRIPVPLP
jgi:hypothetical protein